MSSPRSKDPPSRSGARGESKALKIELTEAASEQMRVALAAKPAGFAVRLFVGGGAHPAVGMSVDRPSDRDEVLTLRGVPIAIDSGSRPFLDEAKVDYVTTAEGAGFAVTGPNTPGAAPAPASPPSSSVAKDSGKAGPKGFEAEARAALKKVYDPEIPMNIVDLGLIYELELTREGVAQVKMTMTTPGCPVIEMLLDEVKGAVSSVPGVKTVNVDIVWDPPWSPEKMSEFAKRQLGFA